MSLLWRTVEKTPLAPYLVALSETRRRLLRERCESEERLNLLRTGAGASDGYSWPADEERAHDGGVVDYEITDCPVLVGGAHYPSQFDGACPMCGAPGVYLVS